MVSLVHISNHGIEVLVLLYSNLSVVLLLFTVVCCCQCSLLLVPSSRLSYMLYPLFLPLPLNLHLSSLFSLLSSVPLLLSSSFSLLFLYCSRFSTFLPSPPAFPLSLSFPLIPSHSLSIPLNPSFPLSPSPLIPTSPTSSHPHAHSQSASSIPHSLPSLLFATTRRPVHITFVAHHTTNSSPSPAFPITP